MAVRSVLPRALSGETDSAEHSQVLVIGETGVIAEALTLLLRSAGLSARHVTAQAAELALVRHRPEAVLLDGRLAPGTVASCSTTARRHCAGARVIVLTDEDGAEPSVAVDMVVSAWCTPEELFAAVRGDRRPSGAKRRSEVRGPDRGRLSQLTARELQVLRTLMLGASNAQIATRLGISPHTVRTHVQNILGKLDTRSRLEAVTMAYRHGLRPLVDSDVGPGAR
jgi:DNA-binding NarL/FixJ family response regulator